LIIAAKHALVENTQHGATLRRGSKRKANLMQREEAFKNASIATSLFQTWTASIAAHFVETGSNTTRICVSTKTN